jgi:hypothetical protein
LGADFEKRDFHPFSFGVIETSQLDFHSIKLYFLPSWHIGLLLHLSPSQYWKQTLDRDQTPVFNQPRGFLEPVHDNVEASP